MSQHDMNIANAAGATVRSDLNDALAALVSNSSGATAPSTTFAYQWWADTTSGWLKQRNAANSGWIFVAPLAGHGEADLASATTTDIGAQTSDTLRITGTTTITGLGTADAGRAIRLRFAGALTLTHNATSLILPGGANITTAAGDTCEAVSLGSGNWSIRAYQKASGTAVVGSGITLGTPSSSTGVTYKDFTIPAGTKKVDVSFVGVSTSGTSNLLLQLGDAGGIETTGYTSRAMNGAAGAASSTAGLIVTSTNLAAGSTLHGIVSLTLQNASSFQWAASGILNDQGGGNDIYTSAGSKATSQETTTIRITTVGGTETFDAGEINIAYQ